MTQVGAKGRKTKKVDDIKYDDYGNPTGGMNMRKRTTAGFAAEARREAKEMKEADEVIKYGVKGNRYKNSS